GITLGKIRRAAIIDRIAGDVEYTPKPAFAHRHADWTAGIVYVHPALQSFGRRHRDGTDPVFAEMLLYFEREFVWVAVDFVLDFERAVDFRQFFYFRKFHVHYGTDYLNDVSFIHKS